MKVIDLFAGCGGFSTGFMQAGFDISKAVEFDTSIANTYQLNHPATKMMIADIGTIDISSSVICFLSKMLIYSSLNRYVPIIFYYRKIVGKIYRLIGVIATASFVSICLFLSYELITINSTQSPALSKSDLPKKFLN